MKKILFSLAILSGVFLVGCGSENNEVNELVVFNNSDTGSLYQMNFDGSDVKPFDSQNKPVKEWERQREILNNICSGWSSDPADPILLFSPDGVSMGLLEDGWEPNWSPDGEFVAVACGRADSGEVVVVSNTEQSGDSDMLWSREKNGEKQFFSDRIEIFVVAADGSKLSQLTSNDAGDWLPRWFPLNQASPDSEFYKQIVSPPLLIESNRDGNSEIYLIATTSTKSWRLTNNVYQDQSPVWSSKGTAVAFASDINGEFEIFYTLDPSNSSPIKTGEKGRPHAILSGD